MLPLALVGAIIPVTLIVILAIYAATNVYSQEDLVKARVAIVADDMSDKTYGKIMTFLENMDSTSTALTFEKMEPDEAKKQLDSGDIVGIMHLPAHVVGGIIRGEDTAPIDVIFPKTFNLSTVFLSELTKSAVSYLTVAQACTYATYDIYDKIANNDIDAAIDTMDIINLSYVLNREDMFKVKTIGSSNANNMMTFYIASGILLFMLFLGCAFTNTLKNDEDAFLFLLYSKKIRSGYYILYKLAGYVLCLWALLMLGFTALTLIIKGNKTLTPVINANSIITMLMIALLIGAFTLMIFQLSKNPSSSILLLFLLGSVMTIMSGCIIPKAFFPTKIAAFGSVLPTGYIHKGLINLLTGQKYASFIPMLIYSFCFYEIAVIMAMINKRRAR